MDAGKWWVGLGKELEKDIEDAGLREV
ncbi:hypothetical protein IBTHAUMO2_590024 [Nitrosopumilaceae archaeon]|nr:hypothetical protein IBTHAUMO2_590024 [Nitrosopumilaceae archaeon]